MTLDKRVLNEDEIIDLLCKAPVGYLAMAKENKPYLIPLNYLFSDGNIYFHCALEGKKIEYIKTNPWVCFHASETGGLISGDSPCSHNYNYRSVIIEGSAIEITGSEEKEAILRKLVAKYSNQKVAESMISAKRIETTGVYKIVPGAISGKRNS